jgi:Histidine phosphatase superfamily (branch 1)
MNVFVRKIAQYHPEHDGLDRYDGYEEITTKRFDPPIVATDETVVLPEGVAAIVSSDALRAKQTVDLYTKSIALPTSFSPLFTEVTFSLKKRVTKDEYQEYGSNLVRERFIQAFVSDALDESREELKLRIRSCLTVIEEQKAHDLLVISHSFFMKILEIYVKTDAMLFDQPELFAEHVDPTKKLYNFNTGFDFEIENGRASLK